MATQWKQNVSNTVSIDLGPYDIYGKEQGFTLHHKIKGNVNTVDTGATWTEVKHNIVAPNTFNSNGLTPEGSATITVDISTDIVAGQVYQAGTVFLYVSSLSGNTITLRRLTKEEIPDNTAFSQVGNTGIYETSLTLSVLGQYLVIISNPSIGLLNESSKVDVVGNVIDDIAADIVTSDTGINDKLDSISSSLGLVDTAITGKLIL